MVFANRAAFLLFSYQTTCTTQFLKSYKLISVFTFHPPFCSYKNPKTIAIRKNNHP